MLTEDESGGSSGSAADDYSDSDGEETEHHEIQTALAIRAGTMAIKNSDGSYRCPLSPGRKKQSYKYREILAHATGVANGKRGPEKKGGHRAIMKALHQEMENKPAIPQAVRVLYLEQAVPTRRGGAMKLLAPWMGILVGIDNSRRDAKGFRVGAGAAAIKEKLKVVNLPVVMAFEAYMQEYNPEKMDVFHDYMGHQGTAVVTFRNDIHGLEDAQAFEQCFAAIGRGRKEWWDDQRPANKDLYGWQATEEDLTADLGQLTKHLRKFSDLKTVRDMVEESQRLNKQVVNDLVQTVDEKNDKLAQSSHQFVVMRNIVAEVDALRVQAEAEKKEMEEQLKRELEEMKLQSQAKEAAHSAKVLSHQVALTNKLRQLENRCGEMEKNEMKMRLKNAEERLQFEREKKQALILLEEANKQAEIHAAMQCKQRDEQKAIIIKHEDENKELEMDIQSKKKKLMRKQQFELQNQQVKEMLEIVKSEQDKEKIKELEAEQEMLQSMVEALSEKERTANDEIVEARKAAIEVLDKYGDNQIGLKLQGSINKGPWKTACRKKFKYHPEGYEMAMAKLISEWEERIADQEYHPFETQNLGGDNWKRVIRDNDPHLMKLKNDLGVTVMQTVTTAFMEVEEYNASGRYPVYVAWDFRNNKRVLLKDLLSFLKGLLDAKEKNGKAKKLRVN